MPGECPLRAGKAVSGGHIDSAAIAAGTPRRLAGRVMLAGGTALGWLFSGRMAWASGPAGSLNAVDVIQLSVLFGVMGWHFGLDWQLPAFLYLAAIGVALALIDLDVHRLPNAIVLPSYAVVAVLLLLPAALDGRWHDYLRAGLGGLVLFAFYFLLVLVYPAGMGFGDVKLAGVLGAYLGWLGWGVLAVGGFLGFLLGGVVGGALMVAQRAGRKTKIPFGPFMLGGAGLAILVGGALVDWYRGLFGI